MKVSHAASAGELADSTPDISAVSTLVNTLRDRLRKAAASRSLRRELGGLDDAVLRDIGISEDEIWRLRSSQSITPINWM